MIRALQRIPLEVVLLAPRICELGHDPCGGSEVVLWEDHAIIRLAAIPVRVYGRAALSGTPVKKIPVRTNLPLVSSLEYCGQLLLQERLAIVVAYNEPMLAGLAPQRAIVRFDWPTPLPRYWRLPGWLGRFRRALYLFPSQSERRLFLGMHPLIPEASTVVIPNAVDLRLFRSTYTGYAAPRVGFAGQWAREKGTSVLLDAWGLVRRKLPAAELWLAGSAELWKSAAAIPGAQEISDRAEEMACQGLLRIAGEYKRSEMPGFWNSMSVAAVPSLREAFGLAAVEAMACGVPVVASAASGLPEIVVDGECGLLVPPNDPQRLAEALVALLTNEPLRKRLAEGARRRAEMFSVDHRAEQLLVLLENRARGR